MTSRYVPRFTYFGQQQLGQLVAIARREHQNTWQPKVPLDEEKLDRLAKKGKASDLSLEEKLTLTYQAEKHWWSQEQLAEIINREFGLIGENRVNRWEIQRLESPPPTRSEPPRQLLIYLANLEILQLGDGTILAGNDLEILEAIAQERIDVETGRWVSPPYRSERCCSDF